MIRAATWDDIPAIVSMARRFHDAHGQDHKFNEQDFTTFIKATMQGNCVLVSERSFLIGSIVPDPTNFGVLIGHQIYWWSEDGKGRAIQRAFNQWAKQNGACEVHVSHPWKSERVGKLLERDGYEPALMGWRKEL